MSEQVNKLFPDSQANSFFVFLNSQYKYLNTNISIQIVYLHLYKIKSK